MLSRQLKYASAALACLLLLTFFANPALAQHSDWLLGTLSDFEAAAQPAEGHFYSNTWSCCQTSGSGFAGTGPVKCGPLDHHASASALAETALSISLWIRTFSVGRRRTRSWRQLWLIC